MNARKVSLTGRMIQMGSVGMQRLIESGSLELVDPQRPRSAAYHWQAVAASLQHHYRTFFTTISDSSRDLCLGIRRNALLQLLRSAEQKIELRLDPGL